MKTEDFSETIAVSALKGSRSRHLIESMKVCQGHFFTIYFQGFVCFVLNRPRYQVSVYRTIGPLVYNILKPGLSFKCIMIFEFLPVWPRHY